MSYILDLTCAYLEHYLINRRFKSLMYASISVFYESDSSSTFGANEGMNIFRKYNYI